MAGIDRFASSSLWIMLTGSLGTTTPIFLPANSLQFIFDVSQRDGINSGNSHSFQYKNLGVLSTLRVGQSTGEDRSHVPSKWFVEYVS